MDDFEKKTKQSSKVLKFFHQDLSGVSKLFNSAFGRTLSFAGLVLFGKSVLSASSNLEELESKARVVFGDTFDEVERQSERIAQSVGRSSSQILQFSADMGAIIEPTGIAGRALAEMSTQFAQLAVDLASFHNTTDIQAFNALRSAITGELEPLKRFGVVMTQANLKAYALNQGVTENIESFNQAQLTALRYNFILEQTTGAQGDAERTADSLANQTRRLAGNWRSFQEELGKDATPAAAGGLKLLNGLLVSFTANVGAAIDAVSILFGAASKIPGLNLVGDAFSIRAQQAEAQQNYVNSLNDLADTTEVELNKTIEEYNRKFGASKDISLLGTTGSKKQRDLQKQLKELEGLGLTRSGGGGKSAVEDEAKSLEKKLKLQKQEIELQKDFLEQKKTIAGLTKQEERQLERLKTAVDGAFDISNAESFADILKSVNDAGGELEDLYESLGDKVETLEEKLQSASEQSKERLESLREEREKLVASFTDEDLSQDVRRAEKLADAYFEAKQRIDGGQGSGEDFNTVSDVRTLLSDGGQVATAIETQLQLLNDLKNAKSEAERINIQAAFDERDEATVRQEKLDEIDARIAAEKQRFEEQKTQIQAEIDLNKSAQSQITQAFKEQYALRSEYARLSADEQIKQLDRIRAAAQQTMSVLTGAASGATSVVNNKNQNVTVNNYGDAAKQNTDLEMLKWKADHLL